MKEKSKYQEKCRLKKGDDVVVLAGKCRGETGKIDKVDLKTGRIFVGGVNISKRHSKPTGMNDEGVIIDKVKSLHWSNVALYDAKKKKASRIGYKMENGKKVRVSKASNTVL